MDTVNKLKALSDQHRMEILIALIKHPYCVRALSERLGISEAAVSKHLKILREAGFLTSHRRGNYVHYSVHKDSLVSVASEILEVTRIEREPCDVAKEVCRSMQSQGFCKDVNSSCRDKGK